MSRRDHQFIREFRDLRSDALWCDQPDLIAGICALFAGLFAAVAVMVLIWFVGGVS
ncbi:hypothetical protein [Novosphingobium sp. M1R2S20]|uniref:Uncharacterized protein n=1 Tax=Novosphingobium rhizovicinum TaxID=3228928 RepID=A0ABV3RCQ3_9SPHN